MNQRLSARVPAFVSLAAGNLLRFRLRTAVVAACLFSAALPLLTATALLEGIKRQALAALDCGPDLLVAADEFGRPGPVEFAWGAAVAGLPGVESVAPRVFGRALIEDLPAMLVGVGEEIEGAGAGQNGEPPRQGADEGGDGGGEGKGAARAPDGFRDARRGTGADADAGAAAESPGSSIPGRENAVAAVPLGRANRETADRGGAEPFPPSSLTRAAGLAPGELLVGAALARHYGLGAGDTLRIALPVEGPELYRYASFTVRGFLDPAEHSIWSAGLIAGRLEDVQRILSGEGRACDLLVRCRPGFAGRLAVEIRRLLGPRALVQDREMMRGYFHQGFDLRGGAFLAYYLAAAVLAIPVVALASGFGLSARRREVALMKALGWETSEVLVLHVLEATMIALAAASLAVLASLLWLRLGAGWPLDRFMIPGAEELPPFSVPFALGGRSALAVYVYSLTTALSGSLAAAWRAASVEPGAILLGEG